MKYLVLILLSGCGLTIKLDHTTINEVYIWSQNTCPMICDAFETEWTGKVVVGKENIDCVCNY